MGHPRFSGEEIAQRGQDLYENRIRQQVETEANLGKIVSINIETGEYAVAETSLASSDILLEHDPGAAVYGIRIGYDAVYSLGGVLTRTIRA